MEVVWTVRSFSDTRLRGTHDTDTDPSAKIWKLYLSQAGKFDKERSDSLMVDIDGVLVFVSRISCHHRDCYSSRGVGQTGIFSATVASFILVSYQDLRPNPSDLTNALLAQISLQLSALQNGTSPSVPLPSSLVDQSSFQPTASAVRVNTLWFTSLALSTFCATGSMLMQQWTRRFSQVADGPYVPTKRARIRSYFADGVEKFGLASAVDVFPALLQASVLLFYAGLVDFLFNVNHTIAYCLLSLVALGVLIYFLLTIMPLFFHNSPYQTPLSSLVWFAIEASHLIKLWLRRKPDRVKDAIRDRKDRIKHGMRLALEKTALSSYSDAHALQWTLMSLDEDHELEEFLDGLPGLFHGSTRHRSMPLKGELEQLVDPVADKLFATCTTGLLRTVPDDNVSRPASERYGASRAPSIGISMRFGTSGPK
jgi:hypothetical protein